MSTSKRDAAFVKAWIETDTNAEKFTPKQVQAVRKLCRQFFDLGLKLQPYRAGERNAHH